MKPKILITTSTFPRWLDDTQPRFILDFAQAISPYFDVFVLAPGCKGARQYEIYGDVSIYRFSYFFKNMQSLAYGDGMADNLRKNKLLYLLLPFFIFFQFLSAYRIILRHNIGILNTHWIYPQGVVGLLLKYVFGRKLFWVVHSHGGDLYRFTQLNLLKRWVIKKSNLTCVVSNAMRRMILDVIVRDREMEIVVNSMGVDFKTTFFEKTPFYERSGMIFVGRLTQKKGVDVILNAVGLLEKLGIYIDMTIVGGGDRLVYERLCAENKISNRVTFYGEATHREISELLNKHKYFLFSSRVATSGDEEGLGLAPIEAMGAGCLVVASDIPQVRDYVIHNNTGVLVSPDDCSSIADVIAKLESTPEIAQNIAGNGRAFVVNKYDWATVSKQFYKEVHNRMHKNSNRGNIG